MTDIDDHILKYEKIRNLLQDRGLTGLILSTQTNFLWFTSGKSNRIIKNDDLSLVYLFISKDKKYLISWPSDSTRLIEEELDGLGFELVTYRWHDQYFLDALKKINVAGNIGADFTAEGFTNIEEDLSILRMQLTEYEIEKARLLCREYSRIITDFCIRLKPGIKEEQVAADFNCTCLKNNINLPVIMVGSDNRIYRYRHPVATGKKVEKYIMLATVAERDGLNASLTRSVHFGKASDDLKRRHKAVNYIEAFLYNSSNPGVNLKDIFEMSKDVYKKLGFEGEWKNHILGGTIAYKPREILARPSSDFIIKPGLLMGWNPTVTGAKAEDMILINNDGAEQLSIDDRWPASEINIDGKIYLKPEILEL